VARANATACKIQIGAFGTLIGFPGAGAAGYLTANASRPADSLRGRPQDARDGTGCLPEATPGWSPSNSQHRRPLTGPAVLEAGGGTVHDWANIRSVR